MKEQYLKWYACSQRNKRAQSNALSIIVPILFFVIFVFVFLALLFMVNKMEHFKIGPAKTVSITSEYVNHSILPSLLKSRVEFVEATGKSTSQYNISLYEVLYYYDLSDSSDTLLQKYVSNYQWQLQNLDPFNGYDYEIRVFLGDYLGNYQNNMASKFYASSAVTVPLKVDEFDRTYNIQSCIIHNNLLYFGYYSTDPTAFDRAVETIGQTISVTTGLH